MDAALGESFPNKFAKVFKTPDHDDTLIIPWRFSNYCMGMRGSIPSEVTLSVEEGLVAEVTIEKNGLQDYYFGKGWNLFHSSYNVEANDIMMFTYDPPAHFWVTIFDGEGVERGDFDYIRSKKSSYLSASGSPVRVIKENYDKCSVVVGPHINSLALPMGFARAHLSEGSNTKILKLSHSPILKSWEVTCKLRTNTACVTAGWKKFAKFNKLKEGDTCEIKIIEESSPTWLVSIYKKYRPEED